jgi:dolichol-phosphate mannosyltransferase
MEIDRKAVPTYAVVIPLLNEVESVDGLLMELCATLPPQPSFEVIIVDDGSDDGTAAALAVWQQRAPSLQVLRHVCKAGKSAALRTGARAAHAPWLVTLDGDGQNDPRDIPRLLACAAEDPGLAMVAGWRLQRRDGWSKRIASRLGNGLRRIVLRDACPDTACGLKLIRRDAFLALPFFDSLHRFLPALLRAHGLRYANLAVADRPRLAGQSKYGNLSRAALGFFDLLGTLWLCRRTTPGVVAEDAGGRRP